MTDGVEGLVTLRLICQSHSQYVVPNKSLFQHHAASTCWEYDWTELIIRVWTCLITVQQSKNRAWEAKTCHFRRHKHDIMALGATPGSNSIYPDRFKLWPATKHEDKQSLFSPKARILMQLMNVIWACREFGSWSLKKWKQQIRASGVCFDFVCLSFCFSRSQAFLSADRPQLSVTWQSHLGSCRYVKQVTYEWKQNLAASQLQTDPDAVIHNMTTLMTG